MNKIKIREVSISVIYSVSLIFALHCNDKFQDDKRKNSHNTYDILEYLAEKDIYMNLYFKLRKTIELINKQKINFSLHPNEALILWDLLMKTDLDKENPVIKVDCLNFIEKMQKAVMKANSQVYETFNLR